jgi:5-hydroxyisourate hydrolase-like protein (transthyretin family)
MKTIFTILLGVFCLNLSNAQTVGIDITFTYVQKADATYLLKAKIVDEEAEEPVEGITIQYSVSINSESKQLGSAVTNANGVSEFKENLEELRESGHQFTFMATFVGNEAFDENEVELDITDAILSLKSEVVDSVNTVFVSLNTWDKNGELIAVSDEDIYLFVPRMYSLLPITEAYTNEEGEDEVEFPNDIPGGPAGELLVIGKLDEHEAYGTIESQSQTNWGLPVSLDSSRLPRGLWSPDAPMWMVITFIILMTGVWGHYFLIVYNLFRIKRMEDKDAPITYAE